MEAATARGARRWWVAAVAGLALLAVAGCAGRPRPSAEPRDRVERGIASWYGPGFHGKHTANGEVYDQHAATAAHRELPFDTVVEVRNLDNGRRSRVRINDRGPFVRGRVIDLSYASARELGIVGPGTARVELRVVAGPPPLPARGRYLVQVGAFLDPAHARALHDRLRRGYPAVALRSDERWHRVQLGPFSTRQEAVRIARRLERDGHPALVRSAG